MGRQSSAGYLNVDDALLQFSQHHLQAVAGNLWQQQRESIGKVAGDYVIVAKATAQARSYLAQYAVPSFQSELRIDGSKAPQVQHHQPKFFFAATRPLDLLCDRGVKVALVVRAREWIEVGEPPQFFGELYVARRGRADVGSGLSYGAIVRTEERGLCVTQHNGAQHFSQRDEGDTHFRTTIREARRAL